MTFYTVAVERNKLHLFKEWREAVDFTLNSRKGARILKQYIEIPSDVNPNFFIVTCIFNEAQSDSNIVLITDKPFVNGDCPGNHESYGQDDIIRHEDAEQYSRCEHLDRGEKEYPPSFKRCENVGTLRADGDIVCKEHYYDLDQNPPRD